MDKEMNLTIGAPVKEMCGVEDEIEKKEEKSGLPALNSKLKYAAKLLNSFGTRFSKRCLATRTW